MKTLPHAGIVAACLLSVSSCVQAQVGPFIPATPSVVGFQLIDDDTPYVGNPCSNYTTVYQNYLSGHQIGCVASMKGGAGTYQVLNAGGGGGGVTLPTTPGVLLKSVNATTTTSATAGTDYELPLSFSGLLHRSGQAISLSGLATVATSGVYADLTGKPTISTAGSTGSYTDLLNKPTLSTVAASGSYADLSNKPTIPSAYTLPVATSSVIGGVKAGAGCATGFHVSGFDVTGAPNCTADTGSGIAPPASNGVMKYTGSNATAPATTADINALIGYTPANLATLSTVATSGAYNDLTGKPAAGNWSTEANPTTNLSLSMAAWASTFTWNAATGTGDLWKLTDTASNTGTGILAHYTTASGSLETPWQADANGVGVKVNTDGSMSTVGTTATGGIDFYGATTGNATTVAANASTSAWKLTLPSAPALAGQYLTTDTQGNSSFKSADLATYLGTITVSGTASGTFVFTPIANISLTRLEWNIGTLAAGCTTSPVITAMVAGVASTLTATVGNSSGSGYANGAVAVAANAAVSVSTTTGSAGCSTFPSAANITIHYTMQ